MYHGCDDPSCVSMERLLNKAHDTLAEGGGEKIRIHGMQGWWYPSDSSNFSVRDRTKDDIDQVVIHTAEGYTGGLNTFRDPSRQASAHYAIQWDGTIVRMVEDKDMAWHASSANTRSIGIEHAGFAHAMHPGTETEWSKKLLRSSAKLVAKLARKYRIPMDRDHIISHASVDPSRRSDPGPYWPWDWYIRRIKFYYYRPYIVTGLLMIGLAGAAVRLRRRR